MKSRSTIILLVVLAGCVGYVVLRGAGVFAPKDAAPPPPPAERTLFDEAPGPIARLAITPRDGQAMAFENRGGQWRITAPLDAPADPAAVRNVLQLVEQLRWRQRFEPGDDDAPPPDATGLDRPAWTLELTDAQNRRYTLHVGSDRPWSTTPEAYVRPAGSRTTYVVRGEFSRLLSRPLRTYRDRTVLDLDPQRIVRIQAAGQAAYTLEKRDGQWRVVAPFTGRGNPAAVTELLRALAQVQAQAIASDDPAAEAAAGTTAPADPYARYGLSEGRSTVVRLHVQDPAPATGPASAPAATPAPRTYALHFGARMQGEDTVYARLEDRPAVYLVPASVLAKVLIPPSDLRSRDLLDFAPPAVRQVELQLPEDKVVLDRTDEGWAMTSPYAGPANARQVEEMLATLAGLQAQAWRDPVTDAPEAHGLTAPRLLATVRLEDGTVRTLRIGGPTESGLMTYARPGETESYALVDSDAARTLLAEPGVYWNTHLFALPEHADVRSLVVKRPGETFTIERDGELWHMTTPEAGFADVPNVEAMLRQLRTLDAQRVATLGPMVPNAYLQDQNLVTVELTYELPAPPAPTAAPTADPTTAPAGEDANAPATQPASQPAAPPATGPADPAPAGRRGTVVIQAIRKGMNTFAWVLQGDDTVVPIGEFAPGLYQAMNLELRERSLWSFDPVAVAGFRVIAGERQFALERTSEGWAVPGDPHVAIAAAKVRQFLQDVRTLRMERFHTAQVTEENLKRFGFHEPWLALELYRPDEPPLRLIIASQGLDETGNRFARGGFREGIFLLPADELRKIAKTLRDFER